MRKALLLFATVVLFGVAAKAQTYSEPAPFVCDAASLHPVTSFYQFDCRGIKLADSTGTVVGSFFFGLGKVTVTLPGIPYPPTNNNITNLNYFTANTFSFDWEEEDANGVLHTGTASGTWEDFVICGGRGCQYHAPKLLTFSTTAN
jgi:hypothetical protein